MYKQGKQEPQFNWKCAWPKGTVGEYSSGRTAFSDEKRDHQMPSGI